MKTVIHKAGSRGVAEHEWLHSRFSFSFADWYEPSRMGFGALRVVNDDVMAPHSGFDKHPHRDMEIITIVTEGTVTHEDSMGNEYKVHAGEVQVMSAGTGVVHSEYNREDTSLRLFQIWITPRIKGLAPHYDQRSFISSQKSEIELLVSGDEKDNVLFINQDAYISLVVLDMDSEVEYILRHPNSGIYVFVVRGSVHVADNDLYDRDALGIFDTKEITMRAYTTAKLLIFDVPMQ